MSILRIALRNPVTILVAIIGIIVFSVLAVLQIPIDIFPTLNLPTIYVAQPYGGMTPAQMEGFIATRYQDQFLYVSGIKNIDVKDVQGLALIKLSFYEGTNMAQAAGEVASQVNRVLSYLPPGTVPPTVVRFDASSLPVGELVFQSKTETLNQMQDLASTKVRAMFSTIPGVSSPPPFGGNARTIVINADPNLMRSYNITPDEVVKAIASGNVVSPAGNVGIGDKLYMTPLNSVIKKVEEFGDIPIKKGSGPTIFIHDIGTVQDGADITVGYALVNGKRAVYIPVTKMADASTWTVVKNVKAALPQMQNLLPDDVKISYEFDQSVYVINAVKNLVTEGALGAILTGLMVLLFLGDTRSALVVIVTIPLAIMASVLCLKLCGQTINIMTLSGLALAIGILVDESTVTIENIHQHLEMGKPLPRAILDACNEILLPKVLILFCVLAVFAPSFLMTGVPKSMFLPLSLSIGFAMIFSFLISQTLVPVITNWFIKGEKFKGHAKGLISEHREEGEILENLEFEVHHVKQISAFEKFKLWFMKRISRLMNYKKKIVLIYVVGVFAIVIIGAMLIGKDILPKGNTNQFQLRVRAPDGTRIERTEAKVHQVLDIIDSASKGQVAISSAYVGMQPSSYGTSNIFVFTSGPHEAVLQVSLGEDFHPNMDDFKEELRKRIHEQIPDLNISFEPIELTDKVMSQGSPTPIEVVVAGKSLRQAKEFAYKLEDQLKKIPYLRDVQIAQPLNYPAIDINIDRERAGQFGLSAQDISKSLVAATSSSRFTEKNLWLDESNGYAYQVQVEVPQYLMNSVSDMKLIPLIPGQEHPILSDVADIKIDTIPGEYDRSGPRRLATITANIYKKDLGSAAADVQRAIDGMGTPPKGLIVEIKGLVKLLTETLNSLQSGLLLAITVIFLLLAANYQSFKLSFVVLTTIPAVIAGSLIMLLITGSTLNLQSYMGIIMSTGVSVANAILIVTNAERLRKENGEAQNAVLESVSIRLRPILMTSMAMIAGMIPMASGLGESGDQTAPLGRAVIGGLFASTLSALFILPLVFALIQHKSSRASVSLDPDDLESRFYTEEKEPGVKLN